MLQVPAQVTYPALCQSLCTMLTVLAWIMPSTFTPTQVWNHGPTPFGNQDCGSRGYFNRFNISSHWFFQHRQWTIVLKITTLSVPRPCFSEGFCGTNRRPKLTKVIHVKCHTSPVAKVPILAGLQNSWSCRKLNLPLNQFYIFLKLYIVLWVKLFILKISTKE